MTQMLPTTTLADIESGIHCLPSSFLLVDVNGRVALANDHAVALFGYEREELVGILVDELVPQANRGGHPALRAKYAENPTARALGAGRQVYAIRKNGSQVAVDVTVGPVQVKGKTCTAVQIADVSAVETSRLRLITLVDTIDGIIFSGDAITTVLDFVSQSAEKILGYPPSMWTECPTFWADHIIEEDREWATTYCANATAECRDHEFEYRMRAADGRTVWIRDHVRVICMNGKPSRLHGVMLDITSVKEAEERRLNLEKKLQSAQRMESLAVLAGGIAHDFNNLLVGVLGNAGLILEDLPPESPILEKVKGIEMSAIRAAELTHQMLAYSGKGRFVTEPICLNRLIEETAYLLQASISKTAVLKYGLEPGLPKVEADATQLRQVAMNLLTNASDAIGSKSGLITIRTGLVEADAQYLAGSYIDEATEPGRYTFLEVSDTGCGMDEETLARIFDPFFSTKFTGRGLGLAATLGIIRGHGGTLKVYSEVGKGTTFKVLLPAMDSDEDLQVLQPASTFGFARGGKALVVDDDETVCAVLKKNLERLGFDVFAASDGRQGTELFAASPGDFRVVFLDLTMPHMDGEETFRVMRGIDPNCKVVLMSGYNGQDATSHFVGKGLAGFLQKPFEHKGVADVLAKVLG